uniref:Cyclopropane-fatty-acyl-phospholipid synthase n=1 Tax=Candidatus Kentrum sp. TC TaxID=2126339 RepID=A0A451A2K0_9GAMM|nr:MAG: cyclopropane-fatty-acyl-phospholipid synthase [Candidatus Kentron sp. TC]
MGKYLIANHDCWYTGISLAQSHIDYALNVMCKGNKRVKIVKQDYRDIEQKFDRIFFVGVSEHFGREYYRLFFETVHENLKKDGGFCAAYRLRQHHSSAC